jgi:hypothetical protein
MLLAMGLIAVITVAVLVALRAVTTESNLQAQERRTREAFFAAEAGMAEARVVVQALVGTNERYDGVFQKLGEEYNHTGLAGYVTESGLPSSAAKPWYQVIGWTDYKMNRGTTAAGVDPSVSGANLELNGPDGQPIRSYPEPLNVRYRVFVVDDVDSNPDRTVDTNNQVWIVAVGEVSSPNGGQPYRTVIRSLVTNGSEGTGGADSDYGRQNGDSGNSGNYGGATPVLTTPAPPPAGP